jgi:hypothetical protein
VHHLHIKRSKCAFVAPFVHYLGHVISAEGSPWKAPRWKPSQRGHSHILLAASAGSSVSPDTTDASSAILAPS